MQFQTLRDWQKEDHSTSTEVAELSDAELALVSGRGGNSGSNGCAQIDLDDNGRYECGIHGEWMPNNLCSLLGSNDLSFPCCSVRV